MKILRYYSILFFVVLLAGCGENQNIKNLRFGDLAPKGKWQATDKTTISLSIYLFEMSEDKYPKVMAELNEANDVPIDYEDSENFMANGLISGGGNKKTWAKIAKALIAAKVRIAKQITILMDENTSENIEIVQLPQQTSIDYRTADNAWAGIGLPQGSILLKLSTESIIGLKQVCKINVTPVYETKLEQNKSQGRKKTNWQYAFDSTAVSATVRRGQFIFLAPETENNPQNGPLVGKIMFCNETEKPVVRFCLIICGLIND